jgi:hypothetical protein
MEARCVTCSGIGRTCCGLGLNCGRGVVSLQCAVSCEIFEAPEIDLLNVIVIEDRTETAISPA